MLVQRLVKIQRSVCVFASVILWKRTADCLAVESENLKRDTEMEDRRDECEEIDEAFLRTLPSGQIQVMNQTPTSHADGK